MPTLPLLLFFLVFAWCAPIETPAEALPQRILAYTLSQRYDAAMRAADSLIPSNPAHASFFQNMVRLSRFDDLGDTNDLQRARQSLERAPFTEPFWEALRLFQLGFVKAEQKQSLGAALTTRKAAKVFAGMPSLEAKAFYAIYAYYLDGATTWLPFKSDHRLEHIASLERAQAESTYFWPLFATSLVWMRFDRKEYPLALRLVEGMLARAPAHPVFLQMKADMLFRLGRYPEAAQLYEQSALDYARRSPGSIRWWSAAGNLVRIYAAQGDSLRLQKWQAHFAKPAFSKIRPWLPASLMDSLESSQLLP